MTILPRGRSFIRNINERFDKEEKNKNDDDHEETICF